MNSATTPMEPTIKRFHRYTLPGVLPEHTVLIDDHDLRTFMAWDTQEEMPRDQVQLTHEEARYFRAVLDQFSNQYCPYENLYAIFSGFTVNESRDVLLLAWGTEEWNILMKPIRNVLSRARLKARRLGIELASISETGYTLTPAKTLRR